MHSSFRSIYCLFLLILTGLITSCASISPVFQRSATITNQDLQPAKHVALLLPLNGPLGPAGQAVRDGFLAAYYQAKQQQQTTPTINFYNTASTGNIADLYQHALEQGADIVIGPLEKANVARLARSTTIKVPTLVLNELPARQRAPANMLQFGLSQTEEAAQIAKHAWQAGKRNALVIVPAGKWGYDIGEAFSNTWRAQGGVVLDSIALQKGQNVNLAMQHLLQVGYVTKEFTTAGQHTINKRIPQSRQDADMVFVALPPELARQIKPLMQFYYANELTVYATSLAIGSHPTPNETLDMQDVIICDMPWVLDFHLFHDHASQKSRLYALGLDTYQLSQSLAQLSSVIGIQGKTGNLYLGNNNQINRQLICMPFNQVPINNLKQAPAAAPRPLTEATQQAADNHAALDNNDFIAL